MAISSTIPTSVTNAELANWIAQIREVGRETQALRAELSDEQLTWKPAPNSWCIAECFEHLFIVNGGYLSRIETAVVGAREAGKLPGRRYSRSWFARWFIGMLEPEKRKPLKSPGAFSPSSAKVDVGIVDRFLAQQEEICECVASANDVDLNGGKFASPITFLIRFSIGEGIDLVVTHQRRHLQQAQRVRSHPGFPD